MNGEDQREKEGRRRSVKTGDKNGSGGGRAERGGIECRGECMIRSGGGGGRGERGSS